MPNDNFDPRNPLPKFTADLPGVDLNSFLPSFGAASGFLSSMPKLNMPDLSMGQSSFYKGWSSFGSMFGSGGGSMNYLPQWGGSSVSNVRTFPWSQPTIPVGTTGGGGVGTVSGEYGVLNQYDNAFAQAGAKYGIDPNWIKAIAMEERGWEGDSPVGAHGLMQIMPGGYSNLEAQYPNWKTDPTQNIMLGAAILNAKIQEQGGSLDKGIMAYLGLGGSDYYGTTPDSYLKGVKGFYDQLQQTTTSTPGNVAPFSGVTGNGFLSVFNGVSYSIASENGKLNGAPPEWYYRIDDELGLPVGTHAGLDVAIPEGTPLYMPTGVTGIVKVADGSNGYGYDPSGGVGTSGPQTGELMIQLSNGNVIIMGHMKNIYVHPGDTIKAGQLLGLSGTAGSGAHVHFEYRIPGNTSSGWISVDPRDYLR